MNIDRVHEQLLLFFIRQKLLLLHLLPHLALLSVPA